MEAVWTLIPDGRKQNKEFPEWVYIAVKLFNRCEQLKCLPEAGGLLDQNEALMKCFDIIRKEYNKVEMWRMEKYKIQSEFKKQHGGRNRIKNSH